MARTYRKLPNLISTSHTRYLWIRTPKYKSTKTAEYYAVQELLEYEYNIPPRLATRGNKNGNTIITDWDDKLVSALGELHRNHEARQI